MLMHPKRRNKLLLILGLLCGVGVIVGLVLYALSQNINLFFSPSDMAQGKAPAHQRIRAGGMVREGSLVRDADSLSVRFFITDFVEDVEEDDLCFRISHIVSRHFKYTVSLERQWQECMQQYF